MKKIALGALIVCAAVALAAEVSLEWVFSGYFETLAVSESDESTTVDASLQASDEAELDLDSGAPGGVLLIR